jgi:ATP-dependent exoDNAse (exonuclease V) beta subunit
MEYSHVVIDDDILVIGKEESVQEALDRLFDTESLRCMLYVALTRAEVEVVLPWYFKSVFNKGSYSDKPETADERLLKVCMDEVNGIDKSL